jgi:hypothetical protein
VTNVVVLNSRAHAALRVHASVSALHGDARRFVPVVIAEFPMLAMHYPLLLSKDADTGTFYCGAMLGFDEGENLFIREQAGQDAYRPLNLQRGPFYTAGADLAVDLDDPRVAASGEQPLFEPSGDPTAYLQSIMALMRDLKPGLERSRMFVETLLGMKLLEPVSIDARFDDGSRRDVVGLYTIDRDALKQLPDEAVLQLFRRGYLQLVHHMLASLQHVAALAKRKNRLFLPGGA